MSAPTELDMNTSSEHDSTQEGTALKTNALRDWDLFTREKQRTSETKKVKEQGGIKEKRTRKRTTVHGHKHSHKNQFKRDKRCVSSLDEYVESHWLF